MVLIVRVDISGDLRFALIKAILLHKSEPLFIRSPMISTGLNLHVRGYQVECDEEDHKWFCIKASELIDSQPLYVYKIANNSSILF